MLSLHFLFFYFTSYVIRSLGIRLRMNEVEEKSNLHMLLQRFFKNSKAKYSDFFCFWARGFFLSTPLRRIGHLYGLSTLFCLRLLFSPRSMLGTPCPRLCLPYASKSLVALFFVFLAGSTRDLVFVLTYSFGAEAEVISNNCKLVISHRKCNILYQYSRFVIQSKIKL